LTHTSGNLVRFLFIAFLAIVRPCFGKYFTKEELEALDGDEHEEQTDPASSLSQEAAEVTEADIIRGTSGASLGEKDVPEVTETDLIRVTSGSSLGKGEAEAKLTSIDV